jgi:hypothetical protein
MTTFTTWCKIFLILCLPRIAFSQCDPITSAGQISGEESQCNPYNPSPLLNIALPSGGTGALEYVWLITTDPAIPAGLAPITPALMIPGATGETYDPTGLISQTTWYRRCARRAGCTVFNGETNWIKKEVGNCPTQCFAKRIASNTSDFCSNLSTNINPKPKYGIYTNDGTSQTLYQIGTDVLFQEFTNNQAKLSGSIVNTSGVIIGTIDVQFSGRTSVAPNGSPKTILCSSLALNTTNWSYYPTFSGVITINGLSKNIINDGAAFQVGIGANLQENVFGASGWWKTDGTTGDININLGADQCATCNTTVTINGLSEICKYGAGSTVLTAVPSPSGTYDYLWSDGKTTPSITVNTTGDYSVTISKSGTCTASTTKNVKVNECCNVTDPGDICCSQSSCKIPYDPTIIKESAPAIGGEGEIIYLWLVSTDGIVFDEIPNSNTKEYDPPPVSVTTYYRRCVARKGCNPLNFESSNTIKIEIGTPPTVKITGTDKFCVYGAGKSVLTAVVTGGNAPITYIWSNNEKTQSINATSTGDYKVTATTADGCTASANFAVEATTCCNVTDPGDICCSQFSCKIPYDPTIIKESAPAIGGEGEIIYLWLVSTDGIIFDEIPNSNTKEYDPPPVSVTTYYRRCVARKGCNPLNFESSNTIKIEIGTPPTVKITGTDKFCVYGAGKSVLTAVVTGGNTPITYIWSNNEKTQSINATATGDYKVTVTTADGCTASANFAVEATTCCNVTDPGEIIGDEYSCLKSFDPSRILETKKASGGEGELVYLWLISTDPTLTVFNEIPNSNTPTYDPAPITQTTWYRRCVARKGCNPLNFETANTVKKEVYAPQNVTLVSTNLICKGDNKGAVSTTTTGAYPPYSYLWSSGQTTANITSLTAGKYDVTVTDAKSCKVTKSLTVTQPANTLLVTRNITPLKCNGGGDGSISVSPSGGISPYNIVWNTGINTLIINNLAQGNYAATVTDAIGCSKVINANVSQPSKINLQFVKQDVTCFGEKNASISTAVSGGTSPYSYNWSNGKTTANVTNLAAATYNLTVTDANKCTFNKEIILKDAKEILANVSKSDAKCNASADGSVKVNVTGGSQPFTYLWSNGNTTNQVFSLASGAYSVTVMDAKYCKKTVSTTVNSPSDITVSLASASSCSKGATFNVSGGTPPYRFSRTNGGFQSANTFCNLPLGKNTITVKDANNCTKAFDVNITANGATTRSYTIDFNARKSGLLVDLQWNTDSEFDDAKYIVERSVGTNDNFKPYKTLLPKAKRDYLVVYQTQDDNPSEGENYYRVRQIFLDGTEKVSAAQMVFFEKGNRQMLIYPNPTSDFINVSLKNVKSKSGTFFIYNSQGRLLQTLQADDLGVSYQIQLENMQSGIHKVVLMTDNQEFITDTFTFLMY